MIDTSALVWAMTQSAASAGVLRGRLAAETVHAPHLVDAEFGNVLRRKVIRGELASEQATSILAAAPRVVDVRYAHIGRLATAVWALRQNVTFYDGLFVALAAALQVPLVTVDERLAAARQSPCAVELAME